MNHKASFFDFPSNIIELINSLDPSVTVVIDSKGNLIVDLRVAVMPLIDQVPMDLMAGLPAA